MQNLELSEQQLLIGKQILKEIRARVGFLCGCRIKLSDPGARNGIAVRR